MSDDLTLLEKALAAAPDNWTTRRSLVERLVTQHRLEEASQALLEAPLIPGDEENLLFTARVLSRTGSGVESAIALLEDFLRTQPQNAHAHLLLGRICLGQGRVAVARNHIGMAASLDPGINAEEELAGAPAAASLDEPDHGRVVALEGGGEHHERMLIVGEGEAVHAAEKKSDAREKVGALTAAIAVHAAIFFILGLVALTVPVSAPPQLSVSSVAGEEASTVENVQLNKVSRKTSATMSQATPVVSVEAFSPTAVPQIVDPNNNFAMIGATGDAGDFGMSMSGFGDVSNMGAIPAQMRSRCSASQRLKRLRESGGDERAEGAVKKSLDFLASKQNSDGSWGVDAPFACTGLALLAFLGHCETPESAKYGDAVVNGTLYLMAGAKKNKDMMAGPKTAAHGVYEHAIATYALSELFTMTKESGREIPRLDSTLREAVKIIVDGQNKAGGWDYAYRASSVRSDLSVGGWQIQALKAAHNTGKKFSGVDKALDKAIKCVKEAQGPNGGFKYVLTEPDGKPSLTGAAVLALQIWNEGDSEHVRKGLAYLDKTFPSPAMSANLYAPYYNMQAYFMEGGKTWDTFNGKFQKKILDAQNADGSWTPANTKLHDYVDGQLINSCWATLMLEVYYRYLPTSDKVQGLKVR